MKILITSSDKAEKLIKVTKKENLKHLKYLILMDKNKKIKKEYEKLNIKVEFLKDIFNNEDVSIKSFEISFEKRNLPKPKDIATICYTSGTSGKPKGVILTHENFIAHIEGFSKCKDKDDFPKIDENTTYISYLPLAHVFERICEMECIAKNSKIGFFRGDVKLLQKDYLIIKPTFISAVPRVFNIFEKKIKDEVDKKFFLIRWIFNLAIKYKIYKNRKGDFSTSFVDRFILKPVHERFGGKIKNSLCGGATVKPETLEFIQAALNIKIFKGYGQSEGLAANIVQPLSCNDLETVGIPFPSTKVKIKHLEGYPDHTGEIYLAGPSITQGYYKREDLNEKLFIEENNEKWLKTGDIGSFRDSKFYIVGRTKELIKTSYGEYIAPEYLENCFIDEKIIDIFITDTKYSDSLVAVVEVNSEISNEEMLEYITNKGNLLYAENKINKYEIPTKVIIEKKTFLEILNGSLLTPSLKKKRNLFYDYYIEKLEEK